MCELEKRGIRQVDRTICISPQDSRDLWKEVGVETIGYLPSILSLKVRYWRKNTSKEIVFTGGLSFYPNLHGVLVEVGACVARFSGTVSGLSTCHNGGRPAIQ